MTDEQSFLKAILDAPNDMAPRLVYADWLEEQDDGCREEGGDLAKDNASFIRRQIADGSVESTELGWSVNPGREEMRYCRNGFVELIYISPENWGRNAHLITSRFPINQVVFSEWPSLGLSIGNNASPFVVEMRDWLTTYKALWPQITFHTFGIISLRWEGLSERPYTLSPPDPRPIGDMPERHLRRSRNQFNEINTVLYQIQDT